jgi:8-oxo-dGTP pyrophosphatase MutT (NUDIX family)
MTSITRAGIVFVDSASSTYLLVLVEKSNKWGFPKGSIDPGETELNCALREFKEETGIELIDGVNYVMIKSTVYDEKRIYTVSGNRSDVESQIYKNPLKDTKGEIANIQFFSLHEIYKLVTSHPVPMYFHIKKRPNISNKILHDGIAFISGNQVLALRSVEGYNIIPYVRHNDTFPLNIISLCSSIGVKISAKMLTSSQSVLIHNIEFHIITVLPQIRMKFDSYINFQNTTLYNGYKWLGKNDDPTLGALKPLLMALKL